MTAPREEFEDALDVHQNAWRAFSAHSCDEDLQRQLYREGKDAGDLLRALHAAAIERAERAEALARTMQHAPDLNGQAIMEARAYLAEHMGKQTECAFFDDCIHNAVALWGQARAEVAALKAELAGLNETERFNGMQHSIDALMAERDQARKDLETVQEMQKFTTPSDPTGVRNGMRFKAIEAKRDALRAACESVQHNRTCSCYLFATQDGPCARCVVGYDAVDAALAGMQGTTTTEGR